MLQPYDIQGQLLVYFLIIKTICFPEALLGGFPVVSESCDMTISPATESGKSSD